MGFPGSPGNVNVAVGSVSVTDGQTSVPNVSEIAFQNAAVSPGAPGQANVAVSGGGGGGLSEGAARQLFALFLGSQVGDTLAPVELPVTFTVTAQPLLVSVLEGEDIPGNETGQNGDVAFETTNGNVAQRLNGSWQIKGQTSPSAAVFQWEGNPAGEDGEDGDIGVNLITGTGYLKADGSWGQLFQGFNAGRLRLTASGTDARLHVGPFDTLVLDGDGAENGIIVFDPQNPAALDELVHAQEVTGYAPPGASNPTLGESRTASRYRSVQTIRSAYPYQALFEHRLVDSYGRRITAWVNGIWTPLLSPGGFMPDQPATGPYGISGFAHIVDPNQDIDDGLYLVGGTDEYGDLIPVPLGSAQAGAGAGLVELVYQPIDGAVEYDDQSAYDRDDIVYIDGAGRRFWVSLADSNSGQPGSSPDWLEITPGGRVYDSLSSLYQAYQALERPTAVVIRLDNRYGSCRAVNPGQDVHLDFGRHPAIARYRTVENMPNLGPVPFTIESVIDDTVEYKTTIGGILEWEGIRIIGTCSEGAHIQVPGFWTGSPGEFPYTLRNCIVENTAGGAVFEVGAGTRVAAYDTQMKAGSFLHNSGVGPAVVMFGLSVLMTNAVLGDDSGVSFLALLYSADARASADHANYNSTVSPIHNPGRHGTTAQRPEHPQPGYTRYNTDDEKPEMYTLGGWIQWEGTLET